MPDRDQTIIHLQIMHTWADFASENEQNFFSMGHFLNIRDWTRDAIELLKKQKEQEEQKKKWLKAIADNQMANAPTDTMNSNERIYHDGIYKGLQMALEILTERR